jgi:hypothetical protein
MDTAISFMYLVLNTQSASTKYCLSFGLSKTGSKLTPLILKHRSYKCAKLSRPSEEANSCSASQVISQPLEELDIHYRAHCSPPIVSVLSQINFNIMPYQSPIWMISGFHSDLAENCALLGYYAASSGNFLPTFRNKVSVPSLGVKNSFGSGILVS